MSGKVFLIDYYQQLEAKNMKLEAQTYDKHRPLVKIFNTGKDAAIYSIAVNEQFCVTGSADNYVRVWNPDLSDNIVQAEHQDTIASVDISGDGLRIICGCLTGTIGLLDRNNHKYEPLTRCHTDDILCMEYHLNQNSIITVSRDRTIRIFNSETFVQRVEFHSPNDLPLCVAGHPKLSIFAAGFETGFTRIFEIEKTCVNNEFQ